MRLLFLDFDGVLNSVDWLKRRPPKDDYLDVTHEEQMRWALRSVDPVAIERLDRIVTAIDARVVISSTWRTMFSLNRLQRILRHGGFSHHLLGATPDGHEMRAMEGRGHVTRGEEIHAWIQMFDGLVTADDIVIVDDDSDMAPYQHRLVQTSYEMGLEDHHLDTITNLFTDKKES